MWIFDCRCITNLLEVVHRCTWGFKNKRILYDSFSYIWQWRSNDSFCVTFSDFNFVLDPNVLIWGAEIMCIFLSKFYNSFFLYYNDIVNKLKPSHPVLNSRKHGKIFGKILKPIFRRRKQRSQVYRIYRSFPCWEP